MFADVYKNVLQHLQNDPNFRKEVTLWRDASTYDAYNNKIATAITMHTVVGWTDDTSQGKDYLEEAHYSHRRIRFMTYDVGKILMSDRVFYDGREYAVTNMRKTRINNTDVAEQFDLEEVKPPDGVF